MLFITLVPAANETSAEMAIKSELFFLITHTHTYIYIYREYTTTRYRFETGNEYKVIGWKRDYHPVS